MQRLKAVNPAKAGISNNHSHKWKNNIPAFTGMTLAFILFFTGFVHAAPASVYMENMTWEEIQARIGSGATVAIVPTGGTEQNGPQMVTGKHNTIVRYTAGEIAKRLGNALVTPVIAFVPEGRIDPPEGHMQFPGTISLREETFAMVLEDTARSLKQNGFRLICFIGDHGGNQSVQAQVAGRLSSEWQSSGVRVLHVESYYANNGQERWINSIGAQVADPLAHAGIVDTSELLVLDAGGVRKNKLGKRTERDYRATGSMGDSTLASASYGRRLLSLKVEAAVNEIQDASRSR